MRELTRESSNSNKADEKHRDCGEDIEDDDYVGLVVVVSGLDADALSKKLTVIGGITEEKL